MTDLSKTMSLQLVPLTKGFPHIHDDKYLAALGRAKLGGDTTQQWFDAQNETSDFWSWMADHTAPDDNPFAPAVDPAGNPIQVASNGNVDMRTGAFFRAPSKAELAALAKGDPPPITGIGTIQTHNTTNEVSRTISFGLGLVGIPPGIALSKMLFADALNPIYRNMKTFITRMSARMRLAAQAKKPAIEPEGENEPAIEEASGELRPITGNLAVEGAEYLSVSWRAAAAECAGLAVVAAIPLLVTYLAHSMVNNVEIHNLTDRDFTWSLLSQQHGEASIMPKDDQGKIIPKMDYHTDSWGDKTTVKVAYSAQFQFINSTDYTDIGYVLSLQPVGGAVAKAVVSIPWDGDNAIWVGLSDESPDAIYDKHSVPDEKLSVAANFSSYQVTWSITKLRGETDGAYRYDVLGVIEPTTAED